MRLPAEAGVGSYTLRAKMLTDVEDYYSNAFFSVAEYRAPEFSVTLQNQIPEIVQGQPILTESECHLLQRWGGLRCFAGL
ncbi:MAG UNVERIFIED_CONTAM: hypothetical protein LVT10_08530 [Anaerolineae bacterium]|jgi:uncharacterized protein YfaS (alpha-2-macroglobulin family)